MNNLGLKTVEGGVPLGYCEISSSCKNQIRRHPKVKFSKSKIFNRVFKIPEIKFEDQRLTSFAGLVLYQPLFQKLNSKNDSKDVLFRPGNVHDSNGARDFFEQCLRLLKEAMPAVIIEARMDERWSWF